MSNESRNPIEDGDKLTRPVRGETSETGRGRLIVVCAPSGAGKSSLVDRAINAVEQLRFSISYTTRAPRGEERHGVNYFFISIEDFRAMIAKGEFLEYAEVHGNYYGTCRAQVEAMLGSGFDVVLDIDVQGAEQIRGKMSEAITIFIMPPSREALEQRLRLRNLNQPEDLKRRLGNASFEVKLWRDFDYAIINDDLDRASRELEAIIYSERCRPDRQERQIRDILKTFEGESLDV